MVDEAEGLHVLKMDQLLRASSVDDIWREGLDVLKMDQLLGNLQNRDIG